MKITHRGIIYSSIVHHPQREDVEKVQGIMTLKCFMAQLL